MFRCSTQFRIACCTVLILMAAHSGLTQEVEVTIIPVPIHRNTPPGDLADALCVMKTPGLKDSPALKMPDATLIPTQAVKGSDGKIETYFILPKLKAGESLKLKTVIVPAAKDTKSFRFVEEKGKHTDLLLGNRPVLRYENAPHDPKNHFLTFKPYHHVLDPVEGKLLLTSGAVPLVKENLFPHHRGLFYGFNRISYGGKTADIWHGTDNVFSQHERVISEEAGPVFGRQKCEISWHGKDGAPFATEERQMTAYAVSGGSLIDFASTLKTDLPSVKLDGDPQHAGFQFRAAMEVASKTKGETYYLRPDGKGKPGETRNWDAKTKDKAAVNLPWTALCCVIDGKRWTILRIGHPDNPKDWRSSERDYGRFGDYFEYELTPKKPLKVAYRVWVQAGEMTVEQCNALAEGFVHPPIVN